jgi:hypothetical protein
MPHQQQERYVDPVEQRSRKEQRIRWNVRYRTGNVCGGIRTPLRNTGYVRKRALRMTGRVIASFCW